jgi:hypothetical protein
MNESINRPDREPGGPTAGQSVILEGLRRACAAMLMLDEPPADLTPGARIAWYTGVLSAAIDTLAARPDLYAPTDLYSPPAVRGYGDTLSVLFHARPRLGMAYRLTTYCNIVHPAGLNVSVDPATSAIHQAMKAAALILHATSGGDPRELVGQLRDARRSLASAAVYLAEAIRVAADGSDRS